MISDFHRNLSSRRVVMIGVMIALVAAVFVVPVAIVPGPGNLSQMAGFFPRYESAGCVLIRVGFAYGPNSFFGMKWVLGACS